MPRYNGVCVNRTINIDNLKERIRQEMKFYSPELIEKGQILRFQGRQTLFIFEVANFTVQIHLYVLKIILANSTIR